MKNLLSVLSIVLLLCLVSSMGSKPNTPSNNYKPVQTMSTTNSSTTNNIKTNNSQTNQVQPTHKVQTAAKQNYQATVIKISKHNNKDYLAQVKLPDGNIYGVYTYDNYKIGQSVTITLTNKGEVVDIY